MKETKIIRSGMPYVTAGAAVLLYALIFGMGTVPGYLVGLLVCAAGFFAGRKFFPDAVIEVDAAPKSGDAEVDAYIVEARAQLADIEAANERISDAGLTGRIDDIVETGGRILSRLEEQPNMLSQLRTFLRYYLPTTQKILEARAKLEGEVNRGQSQAIAGRIDEAAATVQEAFHKQLSALDEFRFINLESEMDALRDMMAGEGLTGESVGAGDLDAAAEAAQTSKTEEEDDPFSGLFSQGGK